MNRIEEKFQDLRRQGRKAFIAFITAGDPDLTATRDLVMVLEQAGVDIVELGVPFSDPLADGPTIQAASQRALARGTTLQKILTTVSEIRKNSQIPIALMTYYNPVLHFGETRLVASASEAGVDGLIIPDLPPEEATTLIASAKREGVAMIFFLSPTTDKKRVPFVHAATTGFIYYVSVTGVTGARQDLPPGLLEAVRKAKRLTDKPVCIGFGVSNPDQVRAIAEAADGVIVGSAIIREIEKYQDRQQMLEGVAAYVRNLSAPLRGL